MDTTKTPTPFFIVGAQRTGTTLLRLILNSHSQLAIPEEARFLTPFLKKTYLRKPLSGKTLANAIKYLSLNSQYQQWNYDSAPVLSMLTKQSEITIHDLINHLYSSYALHEGKELWADKSLFFRNIDLLAELFPESKFIHLTRDGRDIFHSWRKMDKSKDNAASTALDWNYKIYRIEKSFSKLSDDRKLTVRYEDLLDNSVNTVKHICSFIGVKFEEQMMEYHKTSHYYVGKHHSDLIFKSIDSNNMYKWKENLSPIEIRTFELLSGHNLKKYGYNISGKRNLFIDPIYIVFKLTIGIPYRLLHVLIQKLINERAFKSGNASTAETGEMPETRK